MHKEHCHCCGFPLTEENVRLAVEDAGVPQDELTFCCPSYAEQKDEDGKRYEACQGYATADRDVPAYWRTN